MEVKMENILSFLFKPEEKPVGLYTLNLDEKEKINLNSPFFSLQSEKISLYSIDQIPYFHQ